MLKIKDNFKEIFVGVNLSTCSKNGDMQEVYTFKKEHIIFNSILYNDFGYNRLKYRAQYEHLPNKNFSKVKVPKNIKQKYYLTFGDIVISLKKPYKVFEDIIFRNDKIIATNNYVILRGIDRKKHYAPYLAYYIEKIAIENLLKNSNRINTELSIEDIKNIELPSISKSEQIDKSCEISALIKTILEAEDQIEKILNDSQ